MPWASRVWATLGQQLLEPVSAQWSSGGVRAPGRRGEQDAAGEPSAAPGRGLGPRTAGPPAAVTAVPSPRETEGLPFSRCDFESSAGSPHDLRYSDEPKGKAPRNPATQVRTARCAHSVRPPLGALSRRAVGIGAGAFAVVRVR